jgi:hypothetical protein
MGAGLQPRVFLAHLLYDFIKFQLRYVERRQCELSAWSPICTGGSDLLSGEHQVGDQRQCDVKPALPRDACAAVTKRRIIVMPFYRQTDIFRQQPCLRELKSSSDSGK